MKVLYSIWLKDLNNAGELLKAIKKAGFTGVELSVDYPLCHDMEVPGAFLTELRRRGYVYSFHLPWRDLALSSPIEELRRSSVKEISRCVKELQAFKPEYFVIHLTTNQAFCGYRDRKCIQAGINSLNELLPLAKNAGVPLEIETTTDRCCGDEEHLPQILTQLKDPELGVCLDPPHIIERRLKKWRETYDLSEVLRDQAPELMERTQVVHVHGYSSENGVLRSHLFPDESYVETIINQLKEMNVLRSVKSFVIEAFHKGDLSKDVPSLRRVVKVIKDAE